MEFKITRQMLLEAHACGQQIDEFDKAFPNGEAAVTIANAREYARIFDWSEAGNIFLDSCNGNQDYNCYGCEHGIHLMRVSPVSDHERAALLFVTDYIAQETEKASRDGRIGRDEEGSSDQSTSSDNSISQEESGKGEQAIRANAEDC